MATLHWIFILSQYPLCLYGDVVLLFNRITKRHCVNANINIRNSIRIIHKMALRLTNSVQTYFSLIIAIVFLLSLFQHANCAFTKWETSGAVAWSFACDFEGNDFENVRSSGELCGPRCLQKRLCTHFTWTQYNGGTCWLKRNLRKTSRFPYAVGLIETNDNSMVCGFIPSR